MKNNTIKGMEVMKNIDVKFYEVENDCAAFVEVQYRGKDERMHNGLLMIDTGSNINAVFGKMANDIDLVPVSKKQNRGKEVVGIGGAPERMKQVRFPFTMGEEVFDEPFLLMEQFKEEIAVGEIPVIGLIGNIFLQRYRLVVDYAEHSLHTSTIVPKDFAIEECEYFSTMHLGLKYYGLPVVFVEKKNGTGDIVAIVDTGSADNVMSHVVMERYGLSGTLREDDYDITGVGGKICGQKGNVEFGVWGFASETSPLIHEYKEVFMILDRDAVLTVKGKDDEGDDLPQVEMLLGSVFLGREGWVLDFGAKAMYKRKVA